MGFNEWLNNGVKTVFSRLPDSWRGYVTGLLSEEDVRKSEYCRQVEASFLEKERIVGEKLSEEINTRRALELDVDGLELALNHERNERDRLIDSEVDTKQRKLFRAYLKRVSRIMGSYKDDTEQLERQRGYLRMALDARERQLAELKRGKIASLLSSLENLPGLDTINGIYLEKGVEAVWASPLFYQTFKIKEDEFNSSDFQEALSPLRNEYGEGIISCDIKGKPKKSARYELSLKGNKYRVGMTPHYMFDKSGDLLGVFVHFSYVDHKFLKTLHEGFVKGADLFRLMFRRSGDANEEGKIQRLEAPSE